MAKVYRATRNQADELSRIVHKLRGGDRQEPIDLQSIHPLVRARAEQLYNAGRLALTTGHSRGADIEGTITIPLEDDVETDLATQGATRLTALEIATLTTALAARIDL